MPTFPRNAIMSLVTETPRYDLGESYGPDLQVGDLIDEAGCRELAGLTISYRTAEGDARLREAIAERCGADPDDVVVTVGSMHALFLIAFVLIRPGDVAVTTAPLFPLARTALETAGAAVRLLSQSFDEGYAVDPAALESLLSPRTRLVSLASPQNPSGVAIPRDTLARIVEKMERICPEAVLVLDGAYRDAPYGDGPIAPSGLEFGKMVVATGSLSKCHGAPGLRLGWAVTRNRALREELVNGKFATAIACSAVDEFLALKVMERHDQIVAGRGRRLAAGLAVLERWIGRNAAMIEWVRPDAGALCCLRLKPEVFDEAAVNRFYGAIAAAGVRVGDGTWFGEDRRVIRIGFGLLDPAEFETALGLLSNALDGVARKAA